MNGYLEKILGVRISSDSMEPMNRQMAIWVDEFRGEQSAPKTNQEGEIFVATADAKGVPMVRYHEYLAAGYPIATGVIEGASRHLV